MTSLDLHVSARVVWVGGNLAACQSGVSEIEPGHLMLGVLRLADDAYEREVQLLQLDAATRATLSFAAKATSEVLGLDSQRLTDTRRWLAASLRGDRDPLAEERGLHRTPASRTIFAEAAAAAEQAGDSSLTSVHLAQALMARGVLHAAIDGAPLQDETAGRGRAGRREGASEARAPLGRDLTALARDGRLRPIVGRDNEIKQLARRLQRTTKRNALLIGDAGVGKTAVVEGLARFCVGDEAPESMHSLRILEISVGDLMAGTRYRGDLEERVQDLVTRLETDAELVAFIDEVHLVVARQGEDAPTIANLLKPVLDGDHVRCIAATTTEEYERHVKQDPAFARRFGRPIIVQEPSRDVAAMILSEWKVHIEEVHPGLTISDDALDAVLEIAAAHIPDRRLPDKAIDLLDDAATFALLPTIHAGSVAQPSKSGLTLGRDHVEAVLREQHGIDVAVMGADGPRLRETLERELVGQEKAIDRVVATLASARRSSNSTRPMSVLLFTGPTGVGKTFGAELIAGAVFGSSAKLCRLNMNEYAERHEIGRLTGAPPGFVGHERPGALFAFVEGHPEGVILLDEIEKAHRDVREYFLQVFDAGEALDSRGRRVSFAPYVFVMTSNALAEPPYPLGFARPTVVESNPVTLAEDAVRQELAKRLTPEFVARVDAVVLFKALSPQALDDLVDRYVGQAVDELRERDGVELSITNDALAALRSRVRDQAEGARGARRLVDREIVGATRALLAATDSPTSRVGPLRLGVRDGSLAVMAS